MWKTDEQKQQVFQEEAITLMDALFYSALVMTGNDQDAKDLVQETYLKAYRFFNNYQQGTNCKAWLYRIMKNTFINKYRSDAKRPGHVDYDTVEPFIESMKDTRFKDPDTPEDLIINDCMSDEIDAAMVKLPYYFRKVLFLSDIAGYSYKEIADVLSCPIGTVRSRLSRARIMMFKTLVKYAKQEGYYTAAV